MNLPSDLLRLRAFLKEIHSFNCREKKATNSTIAVSRAMIAFALSDLSDPELDVLIGNLTRSSGIRTTERNDLIIFPLEFIGESPNGA